jgi:pyruvate dehydrogenase E2 component (dihydrolipoamide acetyltransferase)
MRLSLEEMEGGTFTVSNLGMFGVKQFAAIVNPPQSCILAVGTVRNEVKKGEAEGDFQEAKIMNVTLSCDHRVVDGAVGAKWLQEFKALIENPLQMLI